MPTRVKCDIGGGQREECRAEFLRRSGISGRLKRIYRGAVLHSNDSLTSAYNCTSEQVYFARSVCLQTSKMIGNLW